MKQGSVLHFGGVANRIVSSSDNFTYKKENVDFAVLKMSKISLNKSANLSKDLNLIEKILAMVEIFMNTRIHFGIVVKVENVIIQKVKASFLIVRVMSTLQEREVVALGFEDTNKVPIKIFDSNEINLGGFVSLTPKNTEDKRFKLQFLNYTNDKRNPFTSSSISGDSGIRVYVYDKMDKKWYLVGVVSTSNCNVILLWIYLFAG
ncbi:hypothetical protein E7Q30_07695 [Campylobacter jejuni]|nr:hypothetical protein [Campylobacter jejuni]